MPLCHDLRPFQEYFHEGKPTRNFGLLLDSAVVSIAQSLYPLQCLEVNEVVEGDLLLDLHARHQVHRGDKECGIHFVKPTRKVGFSHPEIQNEISNQF